MGVFIFDHRRIYFPERVYNKAKTRKYELFAVLKQMSFKNLSLFHFYSYEQKSRQYALFCAIEVIQRHRAVKYLSQWTNALTK